MSDFRDRSNTLYTFTKEVALLLNSLGCTNLVEFKKRNICLDDLKDLTDEDLKILNVGDKFDYESYRKLTHSLRIKSGPVAEPELSDLIEIASNNQKQLQVLHIYLRYIIGQLKNMPDMYVEMNKNLKFSEALEKATECMLAEVDEMEEALCDIELDGPVVVKEYRNLKRKYYWIGGGLGALAMMCFFIFK